MASGSRSPLTAIRSLLFLAGLGPALWLGWAALTSHLGPDPVHTIQAATGLSTLVILFVTLAVTPVRRLWHWNAIIRLRRMIGLFAFFYATLHMLSYVVFDQSLSLSLIIEDSAKHPRVFAGLASFLLLVPLALTSTDKMIRRLGRRWGRLHQLVYVATAFGVFHYLWVVKWDIREPVLFALVFLALLAFRVRPRRTGDIRRRVSEPSETPAPVTATEPSLRPES